MIDPTETTGSGTAKGDDNLVTPPAYLREDLVDLLVPPVPRLVVVTHRSWMEPYHTLEQGELGSRLQAAREFAPAFELWLRALTLCRSAFDGVFDWGENLPVETVRALNVRADLLGLAGSSSKPALDALLARYYWIAFGQIRNLLETWRRAAFVRLRSVDAVTYFVLPDELPIDADGQPRKGRKSLRFDTIQAAFLGASDKDEAVFDLLNAGIVHMHAGAYPSAEGMTQLWTEEGGRRVFGPTYSRHLCAFALKWGLTAHVALLNEVNKLRPQGDGWVTAYNDFCDLCAAWQHQYNAELYGEEDLEGAAAPSST